ncbi:uncharacterized protein LOC106763744 [Vigna radiata var. radiata]|uniref:Uncharacterized protein LOC106763744 n=1 Tax=Vigna radiata var. radiata TaxID=3916 RepID=A0A1S3UBI3_VIGRR|nr:uncharacterized protein LOC106763744 [Vigna radiata var. radiata]
MDCAEEIWHDLKSRYFQGDLLRISAMQLEAYSIKQGKVTKKDLSTTTATKHQEIRFTPQQYQALLDLIQQPPNATSALNTTTAHLDVNNAFLHGELHEEVYMSLPLGLHSTSPNQVCKLQRSIYGLKQASRQWFARLSSFLMQYGYQQSQSDHSLFLKFSGSSTRTFLVYIDDVVLAGNNIFEISHITQLLDITFKIKDLGNLKYFLGQEVARNKSSIHISQRKYTLDILSDCGMLASRPISTPMDYTTYLYVTTGTPLSDPFAYRRLIECLVYLTTTRPDITCVVHHLSQFMYAPTTTHSQAIFRILRYLKSTPGLGLFFSSTSSLQLKTFSDSDWAGCLDTRRSITGFSVYLRDSLISWRSKKQPTISHSSYEAKYRVLATTTCELQ